MQAIMDLLSSSWRTASLALAAVILYGLSGPVPESLVLDWTTPLTAEPWRLWSAHLSHSDGAHLFWDVTGLLLVGALYEPLLKGKIWWLAAIGALAIDLGVITLAPEAGRYCGLSGLVNLIVGAGIPLGKGRAGSLEARFGIGDIPDFRLLAILEI